MARRLSRPRVSIVVPTFNGKALLAACLDSIKALDYPRSALETIVVDNASTDGTSEFLRSRYPWARVLKNAENNYCRANNLAISRSRGKYVAFLNNDAVVDERWLAELVGIAEKDRRVAGVSGKILFPDGRINSTGHQRLPHFHIRDRGLGQADRGQFDATEEVESISLCAALFRRSALRDIGLLDEDFVIYHEDIDLSHRLRRRGWKILYHPRAVARHRWSATSRKLGISFFFNNRNRLLFLAKHFPRELPRGVAHSHFCGLTRFGRKRTASLAAVAPEVLAKLLKSCPEPLARKVGGRVLGTLRGALDPETLRQLRRRWQAMLGDRKISVGIYDHALHFIGGGQKYVLTMADALRNRFTIEYIANLPVDARAMSRLHGLPLDFPVKIVPLPSSACCSPGRIDPELARDPARNPFDAVSEQSAGYDLFINANMLTRVRPRAFRSVFVCHFPDQKKNDAWYADRYDVIINNSAYSARWMQALWGLRPHEKIHPPIDMNGLRLPKKNIILSVSRFEESGSKKQLEMIRAFAKLCRDHPGVGRSWRLVLCGGSLPASGYLKRVVASQLLAGARVPIDIMTNIGSGELKKLYAVSKIFWHLCGINETAPDRFEHFGMTTVEAMQNHCVPVAFNGGGQREIIERGRSGFLVNSLKGLRKTTLKLIDDPRLLRRTASAAQRRSKAFSADIFRGKVSALFCRLEAEFKAPPPPSIEQVAGKTLFRPR
ncbi:MAG: glycosyltransferase [Elusimicrobia bacterium]|nr:glycosyltransferase [Elusimicrobiota bacterium]